MQTMKPLLFNKMQTKNPKLIKMLLSEYGEEKSKCIIFEGVKSQEAIFFFIYKYMRFKEFVTAGIAVCRRRTQVADTKQ